MFVQPRFVPVLVLAVMCLATDTRAGAAEPLFQQLDLFRAGERDYALYRIPGVVVTKKGTLLAYCEARRRAGGDWGIIDVWLRRSTDGGTTWDQARKMVAPPADAELNPVAVKQKLAQPGEITVNNPAAIVDHQTGAVHFVYCIEYGRCFYMRSDDDGLSFSEPAEITAAFEPFRQHYDWKVLATGPGHGIQTSGGRLIVPVWLSTGTGGHAHRPSVNSVIYSDDHGTTWRAGDVVSGPTDPVNPSETVAVELADGRVMLNFRHETKTRFRAVVTSPNGATGWSEVRLDQQLPEPVCMGSICRLTRRPGFEKSRILFANPHNPTGRERRNVSVKLSYDEGKSWPVMKTIEPAVSGYSDLAVGHDKTIYCFYERGTAGDSHYHPRTLTLARFNLEWLTDGADRLRPADNRK